MHHNMSTWELVKKLGVNSLSYGVFRIINQVGALVMLPVYWAYLTPDDFGVIAIASIIAMVFLPVSNLGLHSSVERFYYDYDPSERWPAITKIWIISVVSSLLIILVLDQFLVRFYNTMFSKASYDPIRIAVFTIFFTSLQYVPFVILRVTERIKEFGVILSAGFVTMSGLNVFFIVVLEMGVRGYFVGQFINSVIWGTYWIIWMRKKWKLQRHTGIREELIYSIYQLPINIVESANKVVDKFLLEKYVGLGQFGIYSIADKFGGFFSQVNSAFKAAFFPIIYKMVGRKGLGAEKLLPKISMIYYLFLAYFALLFSLLSESFVKLFAGPEYHSAIKYIPVFVLIYFIKSQETVWGRGADIAKRTDIQMYVSVPLLVCSIFLTFYLVRRHGVHGAIYALLIASTLRSCIMICVGHYLYKREFPWKSFLSVMGYGTLIYFSMSTLDFGSHLVNIIARFMISTALISIFLAFYVYLADKRKASTLA